MTPQSPSLLEAPSHPDLARTPHCLLVSHRGERCGVYQFGRRLFDALAADRSVRWDYLECDDLEALLAAEQRLRPAAILLNYHPATIGWAASPDIARCGATIFSVFHEVHQEAADALPPSPFDYYLCPDPTLVARNPVALRVPRFIPALYQGILAEPEIFTVGSFGFATGEKGFEQLCALVNAQFDIARIRINIPFHDDDLMVSQEQMRVVADACRAAVTKPGIQLDITHEFFDDDALLAFLASNTINAFLYESGSGRGISSCTDYALASGRPIAVSASPMFRHLHGINPSICVAHRSLSDIAASGIEPLRHHRQAYLPGAAGLAWNRAIRDGLAARALTQQLPDGRGLNKLLDDRSRTAYAAALEDLQSLAPELLQRKIPRANIQQAFVLDTVERLAAAYSEPRILAVGSFEDTAVAVLRAKGYRLDEIDPNVNGLDLDAFYRSNPAVLQSYDVILSTSVLEHVEDDRTFVRMVADLLAPSGVAVFTVDFSNRYPEIGRKPTVDFRLYTSADIRGRLMPALPDCALLDTPSWDDGGDDFEYEGCHYAFASWVFRKLDAESTRYAIPAMIANSAPWKESILRSIDRQTQIEHENRQYQNELDARNAELENLRSDLEEIKKWRRRLLNKLKLADGPREIRLVLPLARFARKVFSVGESARQAPAVILSVSKKTVKRARKLTLRVSRQFPKACARLCPDIRRNVDSNGTAGGTRQ